MRRVLTIFLLLAISENASAGDELKFRSDEHRLLADSTFAAVLREIGLRDENGWAIRIGDSSIDGSGVLGLSTVIWNDANFGRLTAHFAEDDMRSERFHARTQSILQQLRVLSRDRIEAEWLNRVGRGANAVFPPEKNGLNVVANYVLYHVIALHYAQRAGDVIESPATALNNLKLALTYEAMAQGFLADAFSAGHMLVPRGDSFDSLHPANNRVAHNKYGVGGIYVVNSLGSVWKAFGDKLLHWYAPSYNETLSASVTSLKEVFLVYFAGPGSGDIPNALGQWTALVGGEVTIGQLVESWLKWQSGADFLEQTRLPSLLRLPMPVSATWSIRTTSPDEHGIHPRKHFPQLTDPAYHDPSLLEIERSLLYSTDSVPEWAIPELVKNENPEDLIRNHPDVASVKYVQLTSLPAGYEGLQISVGATYLIGRETDTAAAQLGLGYAFFDDLRLIRNVAVQARVWIPTAESRSNLFSTTLGFSIPLASNTPVVKAIPFEIGFSAATEDYPKDGGILIGLGLESSTLGLGFTNAGITAQFMYTYMRADVDLHGPTLRFFLH